MTQNVKAIVIKSNDRKEKDKNILLFSLEQGKIWATLKGVKSPNAKMKIAQNPFCFGEFILEEVKAGKIVTNFEAIETFHEISENVDKYFEGSAILEILREIEFSSESERVQVFMLAIKSLKQLCFGNQKSNYVLDKFFIELFKIVGMPLYVGKCSCCGSKAFEKLFIDYSTGELVCANCKNFACEELSPTTYSALKLLSENDFEKISTIRLSEGSELGLLRILVRNFENRFDRTLKLMGILS